MTAATFFPNATAFRQWLEANAGSATGLLVGFHKISTGRPSMSWSAYVDEALCFGWIDGVRKRIDDAAYSIRFTPRKPSSIWRGASLEKRHLATRKLCCTGSVAPGSPRHGLQGSPNCWQPAPLDSGSGKPRMRQNPSHEWTRADLPARVHSAQTSMTAQVRMNTTETQEQPQKQCVEFDPNVGGDFKRRSVQRLWDSRRGSVPGVRSRFKPGFD